MARIVGGVVVAPLAGLPLLLLGALWFLPRFTAGGKLPKLSFPLLAFFAMAALSTAVAAMRGVLPDLGVEPIGWEFRALLTLGAGVGFHLVAATLPGSEDGLKTSLRWLYMGGVLMLLWSSVQAYFVLTGQAFPEILKELHVQLSARPLLPDRVTGTAFEPSWLANLMMVLYMPLWIASVLTRFSAYRRRIAGASVETLLLVWGAIVLYLSLSRIGLASALLVLGSISLWKLSGPSRIWAERLGTALLPSLEQRRPIVGVLVRLAILLLALAVLIAIAWGLVVGAAALNSRIGRLLETDILQIVRDSPDPIFAVANRLAYAERVVYWDAGLRNFTQHPLLGIGLGNNGFLFRENAHTYGYRLPEIIALLNGDPRLANAKNLWVRLLAETGLAGSLVFVSWLCTVGAAAWWLRGRRNRLARTIGMAGLLALVAQLVEGFSLDSFALPQLWIMLGLVTAAVGAADVEEQHGGTAGAMEPSGGAAGAEKLSSDAP